MKTCSKKRTCKISKRRYFQLLEIMIAMLLIVTCVTPALHIYMNMYKQESQTVRHYQADHIARLLHAKIVEQMYRNTISFDEIFSGTEREIDDPDTTKELKDIGYTGRYTISLAMQKKEKKEQYKRYLFNVIVFLKDTRTGIEKKYNYLQLVHGPAPANETDELQKDATIAATLDSDKDDVPDEDEEFIDKLSDTSLNRSQSGRRK